LTLDKSKNITIKFISQTQQIMFQEKLFSKQKELLHTTKF